MSLCKTCRNRLNTWSKKLRDEYDGCNTMLQDENEGRSAEALSENIDAELIATGWVSNNVQAFNNQIITKNVRKCGYYVFKKL